jgi:hypothetical protein
VGTGKHKSCSGVFIKSLLYVSVHFLAQNMYIQLLHLVQRRGQEYCSDSTMSYLTLGIMKASINNVCANTVAHNSANNKVAASGMILCSDFRIEQNGTLSPFMGRDHVMVLAVESNCWTACASS